MRFVHTKSVETTLKLEIHYKLATGGHCVATAEWFMWPRRPGNGTYHKLVASVHTRSMSSFGSHPIHLDAHRVVCSRCATWPAPYRDHWHISPQPFQGKLFRCNKTAAATASMDGQTDPTKKGNAIPPNCLRMNNTARYRPMQWHWPGNHFTDRMGMSWLLASHTNTTETNANTRIHAKWCTCPAVLRVVFYWISGSTGLIGRMDATQ